MAVDCYGEGTPTTEGRRHALIVVTVKMDKQHQQRRNDSGTGKKPVYVKPSIDYKGKFRKGHVPLPVSTNKNAIKNQNRSRYYYHTKGKYRRKKS